MNKENVTWYVWLALQPMISISLRNYFCIYIMSLYWVMFRHGMSNVCPHIFLQIHVRLRYNSWWKPFSFDMTHKEKDFFSRNSFFTTKWHLISNDSNPITSPKDNSDYIFSITFIKFFTTSIDRGRCHNGRVKLFQICCI